MHHQGVIVPPGDLASLWLLIIGRLFPHHVACSISKWLYVDFRDQVRWCAEVKTWNFFVVRSACFLLPHVIFTKIGSWKLWSFFHYQIPVSVLPDGRELSTSSCPEASYIFLSISKHIQFRERKQTSTAVDIEGACVTKSSFMDFLQPMPQCQWTRSLLHHE